MTKMAAMPIYGKTPLKILFSGTVGAIYMYMTFIVKTCIGICLRSQVSVYRTIGPLVFLC